MYKSAIAQYRRRKWNSVLRRPHALKRRCRGPSLFFMLSYQDAVIAQPLAEPPRDCNVYHSLYLLYFSL